MQPCTSILGRTYNSLNCAARHRLLSAALTIIVGAIQIVIVVPLTVLALRTDTPAGVQPTESNKCKIGFGLLNISWAVRTAILVPFALRQFILSNRRTMNPGNNGSRTVYQIDEFFTLVWFIATQASLLSTIHSCRVYSPYFWWLAFALVCTLYVLKAKALFDSVKLLFFNPIFRSVRGCFRPVYRSSIAPDFEADHSHAEKLPRDTMDNIPLGVYAPANTAALQDVVSLPSRAHTPRSLYSPAKTPFLLRLPRDFASNTPAEWEKNQKTDGRGGSRVHDLTVNRATCTFCSSNRQDKSEASILVHARGQERCFYASLADIMHSTDNASTLG